MISTNNFDRHYESVERFNTLAGNLHGVTEQSIRAQMDFIAEEALETYDAIDSGDNIELLDGACDLFVTVAGLLQKLSSAGYDVETAMIRVCKNNLSKFPEALMSSHSDICPAEALAQTTECGHVVFKHGTSGKVMKPTNFVPVDLSDLVPNKNGSAV